MSDPSKPSIIRRFARNEFRELKDVFQRVIQNDECATLECGFTRPRRALVYVNRGVLYMLLSAKGVKPFGVSCPDDRGARWIAESWLRGGV